MRIDANPPNTVIKVVRGHSGTTQAWRVGELLQATVRQEGNQTQLIIRGERYPTNPLPFQNGTGLQLRVMQTQPPQLQVIDTRAEQATASAALRRILPQHPTLAPLIQALRPREGSPRTQPLPQTLTGSTPTGVPPTGLPEHGAQSRAHMQPPAGTLRTALPLLDGEPAAVPPRQRTDAPLMPRLPIDRAAALERPEGVRQALLRSGLLFEANLARFPAQARTAATQDFKANLLRVLNEAHARERAANVLNEVTAPLARAVARLQLLQIHAVSADGLDLLFEIPLRFHEEVELLQLRVRRDGADHKDDTAPSAPLRIQLVFNFADTGTIHANLLLAGERISTNWWAESATTAEVLKRALPELGDRLEAAGFHVAALSSQHGTPPVPIDADIGPRQGVVDERA